MSDLVLLIPGAVVFGVIMLGLAIADADARVSAMLLDIETSAD